MKTFLKNSLAALLLLSAFGPVCAQAQKSVPNNGKQEQVHATPPVGIDSEGNIKEVLTPPSTEGQLQEIKIEDAIPALEGEYLVSNQTKDVFYDTNDWNTEVFLEPAPGNIAGYVLHFTIPKTGAVAEHLKTMKKVIVAKSDQKNWAKVDFVIYDFTIPHLLQLRGIRLQTAKPQTIGIDQDSADKQPQTESAKTSSDNTPKTVGKEYEVTDLTQNIKDNSPENGMCLLVVKKSGKMTALLVDKGIRAELFKLAKTVTLSPTSEHSRFNIEASINGRKVIETCALALDTVKPKP